MLQECGSPTDSDLHLILPPASPIVARHFLPPEILSINPLHTATLGVVQGLTEVLPISSSAHLILTPRFLRWPESGLTLDVALHVGTLIALCLYFWRDIFELAVNFFGGLAGKGLHTPADRLPFCIIAATIPAAIAGKTLEE